MASRARKVAQFTKTLRTDEDRVMDGGTDITFQNGFAAIRQYASAGSTLDPSQITLENFAYMSAEAAVWGPLLRPDIYHIQAGPTDTVRRKYDVDFQEGINSAWIVTPFGGGYAGTHDLVIGTGGAILEMTTGTNAAQDGVRYWQRYAAASVGSGGFFQVHMKADIGNVEIEIGLMAGSGSTPDPTDRLCFFRQDTGAATTNWFARSVVGGGSPTDVDTTKAGVAIGSRRTFIIAFDSDTNADFYIGNNANNDPEFVATIPFASLPTATLHPYWQIRSVTSAVNKTMYINNGQMKFGY